MTNTVTINLILNGNRTINTGAGHNINYGASTVASVISGSGFGLIKDGTGNLTFRASTNTFTGNFTINAGVAQIGTGSAATDVLIGNSNVSGALGAGSVINLGAGSGSAAATLSYNNTINDSTDRTINLEAGNGSKTIQTGNAGGLTVTGTISRGSQDLKLQANSSGVLRIDSQLSGSGAVIVSGGNTVKLTSALSNSTG